MVAMLTDRVHGGLSLGKTPQNAEGGVDVGSWPSLCHSPMSLPEGVHVSDVVDLVVLFIQTGTGQEDARDWDKLDVC